MVPRIRLKYLCNSIITPQLHLDHFKLVGKYPTKKPPEVVIFCYNSSFFESLLEQREMEPCDGCFRKLYFFKEIPHVAIGDFGIGAPALAVKMEQFIAWGVKSFISIGFAGSLQPSVEIGDLVLCDGAIRDEGTSHHYRPPADFALPSLELVEHFKQACEAFNYSFHLGKSWTVDTLYRQTKEEVKALQEDGILTVEMEAAALYTIAEHYGVRIASMFTISDMLANLSWSPHFYRSRLRKGHLQLLQLALHVADKIKGTASKMEVLD